MNKNHLIVAGVVAVGSLALISAYGASRVFAFRGDPLKYGPNHTEEREALMESIMTKLDFGAWKNLMTEDGRNPGIVRKIDTEEEFKKFAEVYRLQQEGKDTSALRDELGLGQGMRGAGRGMGMGAGQRGQNEGGNFVDANGDGKCDHLD